MVRITWTFTVDAERVAALGLPGDATPAEVVDALLGAADQHAGTTLGTRFRILADELGDALDRLPKRPLCAEERGIVLPAPRPPLTCPTCGSTGVYIGVSAR